MRLLHSDSGIERTIIKGVASSDALLKRSIGLLEKEHFTVGYLRTMLGWIYEYYNYYGKAPSTDMVTIFEDKKSDIKDDNEREFVRELIDDIVEDTIVNEEYMYDRIREYVKKRNLILTVREVTDFVDRGRLSEAEDRLEKYRMVSKQVSSWVAPLEDSEFVESVFNQQEGKILFTMEGALGELIGPLKRGWFLGIMAPRKRGKTWFLQEIAIEAMMNRRKVAFISLEMDSIDMAVRFYEEVTTRGVEGGMFKFPVFDCIRNKENSCTRVERNCSVPIDEDNIVRGKYKPCTACAGKEDSDYLFDVSFVEKNRPRLTVKSVKDAVDKFRRMFGSRLYRQISLPAGIASLNDVESRLDELEGLDFIPDVIILDYADILKGTTTQEELDRVWIRLKGMASKRDCLVVTVSQSNRGSTDKFLLSQIDTSKDIGKIDQVDAMLTLNQTNEEKTKGIIRAGCIAHRWKKFDVYKQAYVLQQLDLGSPMLDSLLLYVKGQD